MTLLVYCLVLVPVDGAKRCRGAAETPGGGKHEARSAGARSSESTHRGGHLRGCL